jgi:hypothetical protein
MDLCHLDGKTLRRTLSTSPKPRQRNSNRSIPKRLLLLGVCGLIGFGLILSVKGNRGDE